MTRSRCRRPAAVFGADRDPDRPLLIGSVKTNIGHLEAASGVAGLIKVVLSLEHETLPQHLHFRTPSPHIPWDSLPVRVVDKATPWPANGRPRRAGVSSFGFSGTNAHVVIEEAPTAGVDIAVPPEPSTTIKRSGCCRCPRGHRRRWWPRRSATRRGWTANPEAEIADVCFTAGAGRSHFEHRAALVVDSVDGARELLTGLSEGPAGARRGPRRVRGPAEDGVVVHRAGQPVPGDGARAVRAEPVFRDTVTQCAQAVDGMLPRPLLEVMFDTDSDDGKTLRHTSFAQPALFAIEMGLARLWQSWGIEPDVVLGHSVGQYAAACVAGVFGLEDGARLVAERGRLFGSLPEGGRMVAVFADAEQVEDFVDEFPQVSVAAYNGANTVLSGPAADLEQIVAACTEDGIRCAWLDTSHAFHSELLDPVLDEFESYAAQFDFATPTRPLVCNRTGAVLTAAVALDAQYWRRHARQPVQFAESVRTVADLGCTVLMEIGPQPILTAAALRIWPDSAATPRAVASLRKGAGGRRQIAEAVAAAYVAGHRPDFAAQHDGPRRRLELPTYPFQHRSYWPKTAGIRSDGAAASGILGCRTGSRVRRHPSTPASSASSRSPGCQTTSSTAPWWSPARRMRRWRLPRCATPAEVHDVFFYEPIILGDKDSREVQLIFISPTTVRAGHSRCTAVPTVTEKPEWSLNARARSSPVSTDDAAPDPADSVDAALERLTRTRPQQLFDTFADNELAWGPTWRSSLKSLWVGTGEAVGDIAVGAELGRTRGPRADPSGVARPLHRNRRCGAAGGRRRVRRRRGSVPAAAVWAGRATRPDAIAVLLPCPVADRRRRQRDAGVRPRIHRSGRPNPGRNSRVHGEARAA